jgi:hypothetical protein
MPGVVAQGLATYEEFVEDTPRGECVVCDECGSHFYAHSGRFERPDWPKA